MAIDGVLEKGFVTTTLDSVTEDEAHDKGHDVTQCFPSAALQRLIQAVPDV